MVGGDGSGLVNKIRYIVICHVNTMGVIYLSAQVSEFKFLINALNGHIAKWTFLQQSQTHTHKHTYVLVYLYKYR